MLEKLRLSSHPLATHLMVWYVALVALSNIGLGYLVAVYLERGRKQFAYANSDQLDADTL
jgi:hypothetical protein